MTPNENFRVCDRRTAGKILSKRLFQYLNSDAVVLGISRGGIVVAAAAAEALGLPLEVLPCRKLMHPDNKQSIGSVSLDDVVVSNDYHDIPCDFIGHQIVLLKNSLLNEFQEYNRGRRPVSIRYKTVIVIDDLLSSGSTMQACLKSVRKHQPLKLIVAAPFVSAGGARVVGEVADEVVFIQMDHEIKSPYDYYVDFPDVSIMDVKGILTNARHERDLTMSGS